MNDPILIRLRRPNGLEVLLRAHVDNLQEVMDVCNATFGDITFTVLLGGPKLSKLD